ncbi:hypothetical protein HPP92_011226 [Vanilla planifolia]|uniref:Acyl carrier protein n=1 Tax=Vanilla planifolia TaxID=51239 RepID=A0A835V2M4_VANPL|nr:hypothetical protein HPP92_011494 [Vanilla planifolia]KAG0483142.1 hypothetical protein HPP92_011226 [Vanilla planifolia]
MQAARNSILCLRYSRSPAFLGTTPSGLRAFARSALCTPSTYLEKQEVTDRVLNLLSSSPFIDPAKVSTAADFKKDLQLDMMDNVLIMAATEKEFAIEIPNGC